MCRPASRKVSIASFISSFEIKKSSYAIVRIPMVPIILIPIRAATSRPRTSSIKSKSAFPLSERKMASLSPKSSPAERRRSVTYPSSILFTARKIFLLVFPLNLYLNLSHLLKLDYFYFYFFLYS